MNRIKRYAVSVQAPWDSSGKHVEIAVGGRDAISPGCVKVILESTADPVEAAEAAIAEAKERKLPIDYSTILTYSDGEPTFEYDDVMARAKEARENCLKCDRCGETIEEHHSWEDWDFCSPECCESWLEGMNEEE